MEKYIEFFCQQNLAIEQGVIQNLKVRIEIFVSCFFPITL
jgi:hypothetical protein